MKRTIVLAICVIAMAAIILLNISFKGTLSLEWASLTDIFRHLCEVGITAIIFYSGYMTGRDENRPE